jgi:hypothetical protein
LTPFPLFDRVFCRKAAARIINENRRFIVYSIVRFDTLIVAVVAVNKGQAAAGRRSLQILGVEGEVAALSVFR